MDDQEKAIFLEELDEIIVKSVPKAQTVSKYGGTLYTLAPEEKEGQFCGLFSYKNHVQLIFTQGTMLSDPKNLLEGNGKFRRHINFNETEALDKAAVIRLIKQAAKISN